MSEVIKLPPSSGMSDGEFKKMRKQTMEEYKAKKRDMYFKSKQKKARDVKIWDYSESKIIDNLKNL